MQKIVEKLLENKLFTILEMLLLLKIMVLQLIVQIIDIDLQQKL